MISLGDLAFYVLVMFFAEYKKRHYGPGIFNFFVFWNLQIGFLTEYGFSHCVMWFVCKYGVFNPISSVKIHLFKWHTSILWQMVAKAVCDIFILFVILKSVDKNFFCSRLLVGNMRWWLRTKNNLLFVSETEKLIMQISMPKISLSCFA